MFKKKSWFPPHQQATHSHRAFLFLWRVLNIFILPPLSFQERKASTQDHVFKKMSHFQFPPADESNVQETSKKAQWQNKLKYIYFSHQKPFFFFFAGHCSLCLCLHTVLDISGGVACSCLNRKVFKTYWLPYQLGTKIKAMPLNFFFFLLLRKEQRVQKEVKLVLDVHFWSSSPLLLALLLIKISSHVRKALQAGGGEFGDSEEYH